MTTVHPSPESVSKFALGWLFVAASLGLLVFLLLVFRDPILGFVNAIFPYINII